MDSRSIVLHRLAHRLSVRGDARGLVSRPIGQGRSRLVACPGRKPGQDVRRRATASMMFDRSDVSPYRPEKPRREVARRPYRKPTQVGRENTPQAHE